MQKFYEMQKEVYKRDPKVKLILSDSNSIKKYGFIQVNAYEKTERTLDYILDNIQNCEDKRKEFFVSEDTNAEILNHKVQ